MEKRPVYKHPAFRLVISASFLSLALWIAEPEQLVELVRNADIAPFLCAIVVLVGSTYICAVRWYFVSKAIGLHLTWAKAWREYFGCVFFNQVLPGGVAGDATRAWRHRHEKGLASAAHSVIAERILGQTAFVLFILAAIPLHLTSGTVENNPALMILYATIAGIFIFLAVCVLLGKHLPGAVGRAADEFHDALAELGWKNAALMVGLSFFMVSSFICAYGLCAIALHTPVPLALLFGAVPLVKSTMMLPVSVSGWGFREGAAGSIWLMVGLNPTEGIAISITYGIAYLLSSLPGIIFYSDFSNETALGSKNQ